MPPTELGKGRGPIDGGGGDKLRVLSITGGGTILLVSQNMPCVVSDQIIFHTGISVVVIGGMEIVMTVTAEGLCSDDPPDDPPDDPLNDVPVIIADDETSPPVSVSDEIPDS